MKKILSCLLMTALLCALPIVATAETLEDPDTTTPGSTPFIGVVVVPSEADLPEGYVVDNDFHLQFELDSESDWTRNLTELLDQYADEDYIYYFVEQDIPAGYTAYYKMNSSIYTDGNVIIIKNVKEGEPPTYELPETGGNGALILVIGLSILQLSAAGLLFLHTRRKIARKRAAE